MAIVPAPVVAAPVSPRRRYGLFDAASGPVDLPSHGEGGGVRYVPFACGDAYAYGVACYTGETEAPVKPLDGDTAEVETGVFVVLSTMLCGAVGYRMDEYAEKVRRRLEGTEQPAVERALWTGNDFQGNSLGILSIEEQETPIPAGYDPGLITDVVGALERYAYADQTYGGVAYIHAPVEVAAFAAEAGLILPDGRTKVTPMGSVWVFGNYPSGSVVVTGQTQVWRSPSIEVYQAMDRTTNEVLLVAERAYSVGFECFAGSAEFNPLEVS